MMNTPSRWALLSVTDKSNLDIIAKALIDCGYGLLSTGGTGSFLKQHNIAFTEVAEFTGFPEMLGGRVKTLHPKIHAGILYDRDDHEHRATMEFHQLAAIDVVCVNLYDFSNQAAGKVLSEAIHHIDVGGPTMLRAAAKNFASCTVIVDPADYESVASELRISGTTSLDTRKALAGKVFATTARYDHDIARAFAGDGPEWPSSAPQSLRYGENPHQKALWYPGTHSLGKAVQRQGKELSYNNLLDASAALELISEFENPAACVIKHGNPCGAATAATIAEAIRKAIAADPVSAFGGIVAVNRPLDNDGAQQLAEIFLECVLAPAFLDLGPLQSKKNLRLLEVTPQQQKWQMRSLLGGTLAQECDLAVEDPSTWKIVAGKAPDLEELQFAMRVCKLVKSNAIVLTSGGQTIGVGAGQMSRIESLNIAIRKAQDLGHNLRGCVLASDAFFPFRDCVDLAAKHGIAAIIQPGGSVRDEESVAAAQEHGITMLFTGIRHFRH